MAGSTGDSMFCHGMPRIPVRKCRSGRPALLYGCCCSNAAVAASAGAIDSSSAGCSTRRCFFVAAAAVRPSGHWCGSGRIGGQRIDAGRGANGMASGNRTAGAGAGGRMAAVQTAARCLECCVYVQRRVDENIGIFSAGGIDIGMAATGGADGNRAVTKVGRYDDARMVATCLHRREAVAFAAGGYRDRC